MNGPPQHMPLHPLIVRKCLPGRKNPLAVQGHWVRAAPIGGVRLGKRIPRLPLKAMYATAYTGRRAGTGTSKLRVRRVSLCLGGADMYSGSNTDSITCSDHSNLRGDGTVYP